MPKKLQSKQKAMYQAAIEFTSGTDIKEVMQKYNVCYASVYNAIKRFNIPHKKTYGRVVFFCENYFNCINTEEKAYWLGFIMADGNISTTDKQCTIPNRLTLAVSEQDKIILDMFAQSVNFTGKIRPSKQNGYGTYPMFRIQLNSIRLVSDLISLGVLPNKTGYSILPAIPNEFYRHFIRGYFDGDGCISLWKNTGEFSITSDPTILMSIQKILIDTCNLHYTKLKKYSHTSKAMSLRYGGKKQLIRIYHYLYDDATIYLPRKFNKFTLLVS